MNEEEIESTLITCDQDGVRLDAYIGSMMSGVSRNYVQKLIEAGDVLLNNQTCKVKKTLLKKGDAIEVILPALETLDVLAEDIPLDIVYEDADLMIVNKPQGMVVHPAPGNYTGTLVNALMFQAERLSSINGVIRPGIVHRIDKDTSGLLMIAKNDHAHEWLAAQLKAKTTIREYVAIVNGVLSKDHGTIDAPLARHASDRKKIAIVNTGRHAITHYEVLERYKYHTLIKCTLETGRTHQIRVHMASIGYPILGDPIYGVKSERVKHTGQALHAKKIGFIHPTTKELVTFDSEVPEYFKVLVKKCQGLA